ncbi:MSMEG_0570 family nitrogen starvation response protein [Brenneria goodwinii]|uniref:MSMEG_0570 family nitrogen starvation response protein n=1 Tax=Brenneria goodwinii TaxID=1109412 RepID=UPI000EF28DD9|nr:MSMEG_0570 family nitrogen starvation response protein [Brenneria goodwinii]MCG8157566.1 MSMEG_0570 family nitrogen starvation response protein [Brenneria goodwinii]MCG8161949.1 MSMEG_0570 family nitrogen starvation response protein [Brenneria goodwinii]MCG8166746.1 MSMEG_0570 family nitrogen starvation response protein [Brenneria goodwinii]MCG8171205.1 MSMEG_0570 family nitrogen starvation response protein [Brenneria goodwinii]MCG8176287.1 MSMEG_0570 family nitrogen starvation response pro
MPAMNFVVRWPDGSKETCYSPSTAIEKHLIVNHPYTVETFVRIAQAALREASDRVAAKFGYACSSAMDQSHAIEQKARQFAAADPVVVEEITVIGQ